MRILSRKIWRAFPELDQFDDAVCKRYIQRAEAMKGHWKRLVIVIASLLLGLVLAGVIVNPEFQLLMSFFRYQNENEKLSTGTITAIEVFVGTNFIWIPWMAGLFTRDVLLERCVRKQVSDAKCNACNYNLIGLSVFSEADKRVVRCPECGELTELNVGHISEADINPTLLPDSSS